jgi:hypothetical protein
VTEAAEAGIAHPGEGDDGRLLHAADRHQDVGAVDHRPEHDHHVAGLDGDVVRRLQLGQGGVGLAEVGKGGAEGGAGVGLLGAGPTWIAMATASSAGPLPLARLVDQRQGPAQQLHGPGVVTAV